MIHVDREEASALTECPWLTRYPARTYASRSGTRRKRLVDVVLAIIGIAVTGPVLLLAVVTIKLSSPRALAFFVQERTGFAGRRFRLFKLRTMVPHAEDLKQTLTHLNPRSWPDFKLDHDPRVTRIGRILRMTSLDELPQLWNVLRGDMSIVGPRPTSLEPVAYAGWQCERFEMRPGMTGLWQVSARGSSSFVTRIRLDIAYLTHQSLRLDAAILVRTVPVVLFGRGAG